MGRNGTKQSSQTSVSEIPEMGCREPKPGWSWGLDDPTVNIEESVSCTLASVVALHKWNTGEQLVHKGLDFIAANIDNHHSSSKAFEIVMPGLIEYASRLGLNIPILPSSFRQLLLHRHFHISLMEGEELASVAEGLMGSSNEQLWKQIMKSQRSNGSLFNSPSATAAAFLQLGDAKSFAYLSSLANDFESAVPMLHPMDLYTRLSMADDLKKLGIHSYFVDEIHTVLDDAYRCWIQGSDEIFSDTKCVAMAFRLLRLHGYSVSSEILVDYGRKEYVLNSLSEYNNDTKSVLELYKASQAVVLQIEPILDRIQDWTASRLQHELSTTSIREPSLRNEVHHAVEHPYANLERIETKSYIENYNINNISLHKSSYRLLGIDVREVLAFSTKEFNFCQAIHQKELEQLERWVEKYEINSLKFTRNKIRYAYFSIASEIFQPHLSDARAAWAQNSVLTTIVDDFFDYGGTMEELLNLIELIERWDDYSSVEFKSKDVEILFFAVYGTINETAAIARVHQGRCIKSHLVDTWVKLVKSMLKEAEWAKNKTVPTMYEYLSNGYVSFALGPVVLIPLYLMGHPLPQQVIESQEYNNLFIHMSMIGRLKNDQISVTRKIAQGKLNSVSLPVELSGGSMKEEEAQEQVSRMIQSHRRELLRMVVDTRKSLIPRSCKDLFWVMSKILHLFYKTEDGYSSPTKMVNAVNELIDKPI